MQPSCSYRTLARLTLAGVAVYVAVDVLLAFLRPGYSLVYNAESDYGRGPWFWVMDLNFLLRCALSLALAAALIKIVKPGGALRTGLALLVTWAITSGLLAFFADDIEGQRVHGSGSVHLALAFVAFTCVTAGTIVLSCALRSDPDWRSAGTALLVVSLAGAVAYLLLGAAIGHKHAPDGLYERIFLGLELAWIALAAWRVAAQPSSAVQRTGALLART
jgi:hypothetical membrane protein